MRALRRKLVSFDELKERGILDNRMQPRRIKGFPKPIKIGDRAIRWFEDEIEAYLDERAARRDQAAA